MVLVLHSIYFQQVFSFNTMSSQEESNKLSDDEKFKLIEFFKDNSELHGLQTGR